MALFKNICYRIIMLTTLLLALMSAIVTGNDCGPSCGFVTPTTFVILELGCPDSEVGVKGNTSNSIHWSDGSYSTINYTNAAQIAVGSCCSQLKWSAYATGIVIDGKFDGQPVIRISNYASDNQVCGDCQSNALGITRSTGLVLLSIGTKGVSPWIECTGTLRYRFSPGLTPPPTPVTYYTIMIDYTDCNSCFESC